MQEIARVSLDNEMDLILAHRRSMKLAELSGLSMSAQTTFATAVSEVARNTIDNGKNGCLILSIKAESKRDKYIVACIKDENSSQRTPNTGLEYAKRLVNRTNVSSKGNEVSIELYYYIPYPDRIDLNKLDEWKSLFIETAPLSPYEEIKRKNEQLQDLAQKLQSSETQYKTLTNTLPLIIFSLNSSGTLIFANEWFTTYTGSVLEEVNRTRWRNIIHKDDYDSFSLLLNNDLIADTSGIKTQCRLKQSDTNNYLWHLISITPQKDEKGRILQWIGYCADIHAQKVFEQTLQDNEELKHTQHLLEQNITELNRSNLDLQQFAFVASHDLQEPVRKISFYSDALLNKYAESLDKKGVNYLKGLITASGRMRTLINDVLAFSQVSKERFNFKKVKLNTILKEAVVDLEIPIKDTAASIQVDDLPELEADPVMMRQLFGNLLSNSLKYAQKGIPPVVQVRSSVKNDKVRIELQDNGIGFDDKHVPQMFSLFQRLHSRDQYEGTGLGLAICRKIVEIHHGSIEAYGKLKEGATFVITLPIKQQPT